MPNPQDIGKYPVLLFDAFEAAGMQTETTIHAQTPQAARNLRNLAYTLRRLLSTSPEDWHRQLAANVQSKKFYISASDLIIAPPMLLAQRSATLESKP